MLAFLHANVIGTTKTFWRYQSTMMCGRLRAPHPEDLLCCVWCRSLTLISSVESISIESISILASYRSNGEHSNDAPAGISAPSAMPCSKRHCWYAAASASVSSGGRHVSSSPARSSLRWPSALNRGSGGQQSACNRVFLGCGACCYASCETTSMLCKCAMVRHTHERPERDDFVMA